MTGGGAGRQTKEREIWTDGRVGLDSPAVFKGSCQATEGSSPAGPSVQARNGRAKSGRLVDGRSPQDVTEPERTLLIENKRLH